MTNTLPAKLTKNELVEFNALLGSAPVLSTENAQHYNQMWEKLIACLAPEDFMVLLLIRQVQDETWKIGRFTRNQAVGIGRRFRESAQFQAKRKADQIARREQLAKQLAEKAGRPINELSQMIGLLGVIESSVADVDELAKQAPKEFDHNRALEEGIVFQEQLDRLINAALARRNNALEQLDLYRAGLGRHWWEISDRIIDAEVTEIAAPAAVIEAPALVPQHQEAPHSSDETPSPGSEVAAQNEPAAGGEGA